MPRAEWITCIQKPDAPPQTAWCGERGGWTLYRDGTLRRWTPLWLQIAWSRLCGWRVIRGDLHLTETLLVEPGQKMWLIGDLYSVGTRYALDVKRGAHAAIHGNVYWTDGITRTTVSAYDTNAPRDTWRAVEESVGQPRSA